MENKYFTPEISDIRVGYECEINKGILPGTSEGWHSFNFETVGQIELIEKYKLEALIRVPYLTKEQIEAEGWEIDASVHMLTGKAYKKNGFELDHFGKNIKVWKPNHFGSFTGECKDINTFRYICNLLNIQ